MITREEALRREYAGRVSRAVAFVYAHFGEDLGPDEMADPACFLMDNPSRPATDIAMACGFSSP